MNYCKTKGEERREDDIFKLYVADSLFYFKQDMRLTEKYSDIIQRIENPIPQKTGDDVVEDLLKKHGLKFSKGEN